MACVGDPNASLNICNVSVIQASFDSTLEIVWTAESTSEFPGIGDSDTFTGVVTIVNAAGNPIVVATFDHVSVGFSPSDIQPSKRVFMATHESIPDTWAGKTIHISIGSSSLFDFAIGSTFVYAPGMYRIAYTMPRGVPKFSISVYKAPTVVSATARPSITVLVHNSGTGSGIDTVTATTTTESGAPVSTWTTSDSPIVPPGSSQPVSIYQLDPPGKEYEGQALVVDVRDNHGNTARTSYYVPSPSQPTPPSQSGASPSPTPPVTSQPIPPSVADILLGIGFAGVGVGLIYFATRG